jgi:protein SCO1/2
VSRQTAGRLAAALLSLAVCAGCAGSTAGAGDDHGTHSPGASATGGWHGTEVTSGYPLPGQTFTDTGGRTVVPSEDVDSPVTLVFLGYTHCPDICNVVLANVASALRGASPQVRAATQLVFVSTDPRRDTPEVVRSYLDRFDPSFAGLVAPVETVAKAAEELHVSYDAPDPSPDGYEVDHGTYTTAFVDGRARLVWAADTTVADLRADLTRLARIA